MNSPWLLFGALIVVKMVLMAGFSSDYQDRLFLPFVEQFLAHGGNPWQYFYTHPQQGVEFPYSSVMLFVLSVFYAPLHWLGVSSMALTNFFLKIPTLAADIAIAWLLSRSFDWRKVFIYYFASPVILYACYMHSQLDLIPSALLFGAVFVLTRNGVIACAILLGLAAAAKLHVMAAYPLIVFYTYKNFRLRWAMFMAVIPWVVWALMAAPFWSEGFKTLVLNNPQQKYVFDVYFAFGHLKIYLPVLALLVIYLRFIAFRKINTDLFFTFLALSFAVFVSLTIAPPGWYVWLFPFLSIFFIKYQDRSPLIPRMYAGLNLAYIIYVVFFYVPERTDLRWLGQAVNWKISSEQARNLSFTLLEAMLAAVMYAFYKFGIKSNFYYIQDAPVLIGIAGDSAAGKSVLLSDIKGLLGRKVLEYEGDGAHRWEREDKNWENLTHLNPKANFLHQQFELLHRLKNGTSVVKTDYDHSTGKFLSSARVSPGDYIVISGLHTFYLPKMRKLIDLKVYLDPEEDLRRHWKVQRDTSLRGHSKVSVLDQIFKRREDTKKYIHPQRDVADMVIRYLPLEPLTPAQEGQEVPLKLKVTLDSNVELLDLISALEPQLRVDWDYSMDMHSQTLEISGSISSQRLAQIARQFIVNSEELLGQQAQWQEGYRGFVQLMVVFMLSEKMRSV